MKMLRSFLAATSALVSAVAAQAAATFDQMFGMQDIGKDNSSTKLTSLLQQAGSLTPSLGHKLVVQSPRHRNLRWHHATSMFNRITTRIRGSSLTGLAIT